MLSKGEIEFLLFGGQAMSIEVVGDEAPPKQAEPTPTANQIILTWLPQQQAVSISFRQSDFPGGWTMIKSVLGMAIDFANFHVEAGFMAMMQQQAAEQMQTQAIAQQLRRGVH